MHWRCIQTCIIQLMAGPIDLSGPCHVNVGIFLGYKRAVELPLVTAWIKMAPLKLSITDTQVVVVVAAVVVLAAVLTVAMALSSWLLGPQQQPSHPHVAHIRHNNRRMP